VSADFIQLLVGGVLLGGIYGLAAFGLSITFGVLNVLNLAHGEFLMLGSLLSYGLFVGLGINPFISAIVVIPIFMLLGIGFYLLLLKKISDKPPHQLLVASILVTLGASLFIEDVTAFFWERPVTGISYSLPPLELAGVVISSTRLLILLFIFVLALGMQLYLRRTYVGKSIRAITQCREGAKVVGIPISRVSALAFSIGHRYGLGRFCRRLLCNPFYGNSCHGNSINGKIPLRGCFGGLGKHCRFGPRRSHPGCGRNPDRLLLWC